MLEEKKMQKTDKITNFPKTTSTGLSDDFSLIKDNEIDSSHFQ